MKTKNLFLFVVAIVLLPVLGIGQINPYPANGEVVSSQTWLAWTPPTNFAKEIWHELTWKYEVYKIADNNEKILARWGFSISGPVIGYKGGEIVPSRIATPPFINPKFGVGKNGLWTEDEGFLAPGEYTWRVGRYINDRLEWNEFWNFSVEELPKINYEIFGDEVVLTVNKPFGQINNLRVSNNLMTQEDKSILVSLNRDSLKVIVDRGEDLFHIEFYTDDIKVSDIKFFVEASISSVDHFGQGIIKNYHLSQNYPNPFNPETSISYSIPKADHVKLTVYNVLGQKVADLVNEQKNAGKHEINFNASELSSGVYVYRLETNKSVKIKMMIYQK